MSGGREEESQSTSRITKNEQIGSAVRLRLRLRHAEGDERSDLISLSKTRARLHFAQDTRVFLASLPSEESCVSVAAAHLEAVDHGIFTRFVYGHFAVRDGDAGVACGHAREAQ